MKYFLGPKQIFWSLTVYVQHDPPADCRGHAVPGDAHEGAHLPPADPHQLQPGAQLLPHLWGRSEVINFDTDTFGNPLRYYGFHLE